MEIVKVIRRLLSDLLLAPTSLCPVVLYPFAHLLALLGVHTLPATLARAWCCRGRTSCCVHYARCGGKNFQRSYGTVDPLQLGSQ